jgi:hypothetical protein
VTFKRKLARCDRKAEMQRKAGKIWQAGKQIDKYWLEGRQAGRQEDKGMHAGRGGEV